MDVSVICAWKVNFSLDFDVVFFLNKFLRRMQSYVTIEDFDVTGEN
jgi:hypothetical protein